MGDLGVIAMHYGERIPCDEICKEFVQRIQGYSSHHFLWNNFVNLAYLYVIISIIYQSCNSQTCY